MKKGLFTAAVIAAMMMTQPVMAQEVVGQTEEIVAQTEETEQEDVPESPESDMAEEYEGTSDSQVRLTVFSGENNEMPIVSADPTDKEVQQPEKKIGWQTEEGKTYYYDENGNQSVGEKKIEGKWYYFDKEGVMQTGFQTIPTKNGGTKKVCYGADGAILYGKQKVDEKWYYFHPITGAVMYGEQKIDGKWHYFEPATGVMQTGFQTIATKNGGKKRVCYGADGSILYGKQKVDEKWYYFHPVTGAVMYGEQKIDGKWHYCDRQTGAMAIGIQTITMSNGVQKTVCYGADGAMGYGEQKVNGRWYYCHPVTGAIQTGFVKLPNKMVYYGADGAMCYGEQKINGKWYYFNTVTGAMQTGLIEIKDSVWGFYGADGKQIPMIDAKTAIDAAHEFLKETISDEDLEIIKGHYVQYLSAEPEMVDGHSNPQYYIYVIVTEDDADFDENTDEDDVIYGDVIRVDAVTKECVYDTDVSGID